MMFWQKKKTYLKAQKYKSLLHTYNFKGIHHENSGFLILFSCEYNFLNHKLTCLK